MGPTTNQFFLPIEKKKKEQKKRPACGYYQTLSMEISFLLFSSIFFYFLFSIYFFTAKLTFDLGSAEGHLSNSISNKESNKYFKFIRIIYYYFVNSFLFFIFTWLILS